jgi:tetratricopeptide (TPR) repeat protein
LLHELADTHEFLGWAEHRQNQLQAAEESYRRSLAIEDKLAADFPRVPPSQWHYNGIFLAFLLENTGHAEEAEQLYRRAIIRCEKWVAEYPSLAYFRLRLAESLGFLGRLLQNTDQPQEAKEIYLRVVETLPKAIGGLSPAVMPYHSKLVASAYTSLSFLLNGTNRHESDECYRQAAQVYDNIISLQENLVDSPDLGHSHCAWGLLLQRSGQFKTAEKAFFNASQVFDRLANEEPDEASHRFFWVGTRRYFADLLRDSGRFDEAQKAYREAIGQCDTLIAEFAAKSEQGVHRRALEGMSTQIAAGLADNYVRSGRYEEALPICRNAIARLKWVAMHRLNNIDRAQLAATALRLAELLRGLDKLEEAAEIECAAAAAKLTSAELMERARPAAEKRDWKTAAAELGMGFKLAPLDEPWVWFALGLARILADDLPGYEELARSMPARFGEREPLPGDVILLEVIRTCTLRPQGAADPAEILRLARRAYDTERNGWNAYSLGLANYRAGEFELARQHIEEAQQISQWFPYWPALAMTHHRLGQADAAREWLDKANEMFRKVTEGMSSERLTTLIENRYWQSWAYFEAMLLEARDVIGGENSK